VPATKQIPPSGRNDKSSEDRNDKTGEGGIAGTVPGKTIGITQLPYYPP